MRFLGIDPGVSGGMVFIDGEAVCLTAMPKTERDIWEWIEGCKYDENRYSHSVLAVIEKVGGYVAGHAAPGSAMFNFGWSYGGLRMALTAADIPFEEVTPQRWQKSLRITPRNRDDSKTKWKNKLKGVAQRLFPGVQVTLATCDALLIVEYLRRELTIGHESNRSDED
jgi:hypothetical protein